MKFFWGSYVTRYWSSTSERLSMFARVASLAYTRKRGSRYPVSLTVNWCPPTPLIFTGWSAGHTSRSRLGCTIPIFAWLSISTSFLPNSCALTAGVLNVLLDQCLRLFSFAMDSYLHSILILRTKNIRRCLNPCPFSLCLLSHFCLVFAPFTLLSLFVSLVILGGLLSIACGCKCGCQTTRVGLRARC